MVFVEFIMVYNQIVMFEQGHCEHTNARQNITNHL
jgi:hypothetical protein